MSRWRAVTREKPCPACGGHDWCAWTPDGRTLKCERATSAPPGMRLTHEKDGGGLFKADDGNHGKPIVRSPGGRETALDWAAEHQGFAAAMQADRLSALAQALGVSTAALINLNVGWAGPEDLRRMRAGGAGWAENYPRGAFTFPERDGAGRIVGCALRAIDGRKGAAGGQAGAQRGLIVPTTLPQRPDPVLIVEGASDVAAVETLGIAVVGRPSNSGGAEQLARLLTGREVLVVGERDAKPSGAWPGRDGAQRVASRLASEWNRVVAWTLPPEGTKDVRAYLNERIRSDLDLSDAEACRVAGAELVKALRDAAEEAKPQARPSQSEMLVRLALERYRLGQDESGEPFAVQREGPNVALMFRGARDALRSALARDYRRRFGSTPNASALADALTVLQGEAQECPPEAVHLRVARFGNGIVLDLGDAQGTVVLIQPGRWDVVGTASVLFRRTALTGALPEPQRGGDPGQLRDLLNVTPEDWPLVLGWLVAAFVPDIPHPILMLGGVQGTGKSTAARMLMGLVDPSPAMLRSPPKDPEQWAVASAGSWGVAIDNVSTIPTWWSDALCKVVTGDGWIRRKLYTDVDLAVLSFRRVVALTSIDAGSLRGDLGDRLLRIDLEEIDDVHRQDETRLERLYASRRPEILGALLDLLADVLHRLPEVDLPIRPRMSDFARVQAAVDAVVGSDGLSRYLSQRRSIACDVIEGDVVGTAVVAFATEASVWEGQPTELYQRLTPDKPPQGWPRTAPALSGRLKRLAPALKAAGIHVTHDRDTSHERRRLIRIELVRKTPSDPSSRPTGRVPGAANPHVGQEASDGTANEADGNGVSSGSAPSGTLPGAQPNGGVANRFLRSPADDADAPDGNSPTSSAREVIEL